MLKIAAFGALLEDEAGKINVHKTETRARCYKKIVRNWHVRSSAGFVRWSLANVGRFGVTLLLCGFATECDETIRNAFEPLRAAKHE
jgi:hypothetical protein